MAAVPVEFSNTSFEFMENNEAATLLLIVGGSLERPVNLQITTEDGTATGTLHYTSNITKYTTTYH